MSGTGVSGTPDPASSSIMKSRKPDWRKGSAQQAVTRSRERQADLMVLLAGSLEDERSRFKGLAGYTFQNSLSMISLQTTALGLFHAHCERGPFDFHWEERGTQ